MVSVAKIRRRRQHLRWLGLTSRAALIVATLALGTAQALTQTQVWKNPPNWAIVGSLLGLLLVTALDNARSLYRTYRLPEENETRTDVQKAVVSVLIEISNETGIAMDALGGSVFLVTRYWRFRRYFLFIERAECLVRYLRFRLTDDPQPSEVDWVKGKGVIGECWDHRRKAYRLLTPQARKYHDEGVTSAQWEKMNDKSKHGFNRPEFNETIGKYAEVVAVPVKDELGTFLGCLAVDLKLGDRTKETPAALSGAGVEGYLDCAASVVGSRLARARVP